MLPKEVLFSCLQWYLLVFPQNWAINRLKEDPSSLSCKFFLKSLNIEKPLKLATRCTSLLLVCSMRVCLEFFSWAINCWCIWVWLVSSFPNGKLYSVQWRILWQARKSSGVCSSLWIASVPKTCDASSKTCQFLLNLNPLLISALGSWLLLNMLVCGNRNTCNSSPESIGFETNG